MPAKNDDLHGSAPDTSPVAVLLIDVINDLEFDGASKMLKPALAAARRIAALTARARKANVPVVYANDNFGRWRSDFRKTVEHCLNDGVRGEPIVELLEPQPEDYFVLKPKHSAFFSTTLDTLLKYLKTERLILCGYATDFCVLLTAADAYLRDFEIHVPQDCVAGTTPAENRTALRYIRRAFRADTRPSAKVRFERRARGQKRSSGRK